MSRPTVGATRTETDSMGAVEVPADRYWGAQTQRSLHHFAIGDADAERMPRDIVHAMGILKQACAQVNDEAGRLPEGWQYNYWVVENRLRQRCRYQRRIALEKLPRRW